MKPSSTRWASGLAPAVLACLVAAALLLPRVASAADKDSDGDGIPDAADMCPSVAEDKDAYLDEDGCPEIDNDLDGVPDAKDRDAISGKYCSNDPEDLDGFEDADGCPEPDNDKDGIMDRDDLCPLEAGEPGDATGCPASRFKGLNGRSLFQLAVRFEDKGNLHAARAAWTDYLAYIAAHQDERAYPATANERMRQIDARFKRDLEAAAIKGRAEARKAELAEASKKKKKKK